MSGSNLKIDSKPNMLLTESYIPLVQCPPKGGTERREVATHLPTSELYLLLASQFWLPEELRFSTVGRMPPTVSSGASILEAGLWIKEGKFSEGFEGLGCPNTESPMHTRSTFVEERSIGDDITVSMLHISVGRQRNSSYCIPLTWWLTCSLRIKGCSHLARLYNPCGLEIVRDTWSWYHWWRRSKVEDVLRGCQRSVHRQSGIHIWSTGRVWKDGHVYTHRQYLREKT